MNNPFLKFNKILKTNQKTEEKQTTTLDCGCVYENEIDPQTGEIKLTKNVKLCSKHQVEKINKYIPKINVIPHHRPEKI